MPGRHFSQALSHIGLINTAHALAAQTSIAVTKPAPQMSRRTKTKMMLRRKFRR